MADLSLAMRRQASDWLILLGEEPDDAMLQERFEAWLDADPAHVRAWVSVTETFEVIGETPPVFQAQWDGSRLAPAAPSPRRARRLFARQSGSWRQGALAAAAAACVALAVAPSAWLHLKADAVTGPGELRSLQLADGSRVRLGPNSAIALNRTAGGRTVRLLSGQAWFDVKHDPRTPFRVVARDVVATDIGTAFDVRMIGDGTTVAVASGRVRVVDQGIAPATARDLTAGQWAQITADHTVQGGAENPDWIGAWRTGGLVVRDRSIAQVIAEIRPWYGGAIILSDAALGRRRVDGVYDLRDPVAALQALVSTRGGRVTRVTPWLLVISQS